MPQPSCPPPDPAGYLPLNDAEAAQVARALAHPVRIRILRILQRRDECYCGDLCQEFPLAQSTISQHLKILKEAGLVRGTRTGTSVCYCVEEPRLHAYHEWTAGLVARLSQPGSPLPEYQEA